MIFTIPAVSTTGLAQEKEPAEPDTSSRSDIYNPPRVITPEYKPGSPPPDPEEPKTDEVRYPEGETAMDKKARSEGCATCRGASRSRVGAGAEVVTGYLFAGLDEINPHIRRMGIPALSEEVFMAGGRGYTRIGHLLIGGAAYGGDTESGGIPDCCARSARVEIAYGGVLFGATTGGPRYEISAGMLFGGGAVEIVRERSSRNVSDWDEAWDDFYESGPDSVATEDLNITSKITGDFIALEPFAGLKYWILHFMAVDLSASYLHAEIGRGEWKVDGVPIPDSPESNIGGWSLKLGLHFGI
jgi:hypothetical protein